MGLGFTNSFAAAQPVVADGNGHFARRVYIKFRPFVCLCVCGLNKPLCVHKVSSFYVFYESFA